MKRFRLLLSVFPALLLVLATAVAAEPDDPRLEKALEALAAGDTLSAIDHLEHADLEAVGDPTYFILRGRLLRSRGTIVDRLGSQYALERAVQLFPDDPDVTLELGLTYFAQTFYPDAARCFERALEINPELCDARHKLGVTHYERWKLRVNSYHDEAAAARRWLKSAVECDSLNRDAATRYAFVLYALDRKDEAERAARAGAARFPDAPEFPMLVGTIAYEEKNYPAADSCYRVALTKMDDEELAAYASLQRNVLGYDDMTIYEKAGERTRADIDRAYWVVRDFDPTTDINERFLEHCYRTFRADLYFSHSSVHVAWAEPQIRGWNTERGEISIKFGWPDDIHASHGGDRSESWTYVTPGQIHEFYFSDRFQNGNLQIPPSRSEKLVYARHQSRVTHYRPEALVVNGAMDVVAFRDDAFTSSVYVTMQVNADSILGAVDPERLQEFHARSRFFDEDWHAEHTESDTLKALEAPMVAGSDHNLYDVVLHSELPFGDYNVACAFEDDRRSTIATFAGRCYGGRFAGSQLQVSDLLFLRGSKEGAIVERAGEALAANPWRAYGHGQRLDVYFEIYNLAISGGSSRYRLTFEIHSSPVEPPSAWDTLGRVVANFGRYDEGDLAIAQTYERTGQAYDERERLAIDIDSLEPGRYRLIVTVTDLQNGDESRSSKIFYKTGEEEHARK